MTGMTLFLVLVGTGTLTAQLMRVFEFLDKGGLRGYDTRRDPEGKPKRRRDVRRDPVRRDAGHAAVRQC